MMFKRAIVPTVLLLALTTGCGQELAENSTSFSEGKLNDPIGNQADKVAGMWVGTVANEGVSCQLELSIHTTSYSGFQDVENSPKVRTLYAGLKVLGTGGSRGVGGDVTEKFLAQKNNRRIVFDFSSSSAGFGAILRNYAKITMTMRNGQPVEARGERGAIRFGLIAEPDFDYRCVGLVKVD